jgi:hypothetical protein
MITRLAERHQKHKLDETLNRRIEAFIEGRFDKTVRHYLETIFFESGRNEGVLNASMKFVDPLFPKNSDNAPEMLISIGLITRSIMDRGKNPDGRDAVVFFMNVLSMITDVDERAKSARGTASTLNHVRAKQPSRAALANMLNNSSEVAIWFVQQDREGDASMLLGSTLPRIASQLKDKDAVLETLQIYRKYLGINDAESLLRKDRKN